jgi:hypothetical protein
MKTRKLGRADDKISGRSHVSEEFSFPSQNLEDGMLANPPGAEVSRASGF